MTSKMFVMKLYSIVLIFLLVRTVGVFSRDLSESERANRAAFVQKLLNKRKNLEGKIRLAGGPNEFEGKFSYFLERGELLYTIF